MVRFMIGKVDLQQLQAPVDALDQTALACQGMNGTDTANPDAAATITDLVVDIAGGEHGFGTAAEVGFVEAALDAALAVGQFPAYDRFHSKSLRAWCVGQNRYSMKHRKR